MKNIPHEHTLDSSLAVITEGYHYMHKRMQELNTDIYETRLLGEKAICMHGPDAAQLLYDNEFFWRKDVLPKRVQNTLMGKDGVQMLDDEQHRHRKALFMSMMSRDRIQELMDMLLRYWRAYALKWEKMERVNLFDEAQEVFCLAACEWAGVPLKPTEVREHANEYVNMIYGFGGIAARYLRGVHARNKSEEWNSQIIEDIRSGKLQVPEYTAAYKFATYRDLNGELLSTRVAAVELMNIVRPIVAIATYVTYSALALHEHPEHLEKLRSGDDKFAQLFVQEVRRFYPFTPFLGARTRKDFEWKGHQFEEGTLVLLDVYGMLHDPKLWPEPNEFKPERFKTWSGSPFDFIPQGGGDFDMGHRCAGEWVTIEAMKVALQFLTQEVQYNVPAQDLTVNRNKMPTKPKSGFEIDQVHFVGQPVASGSEV
ncbi:cytochrome P450 [Pontibacter rugosus]|uniref:Cytochrome P450 n=1 Tax=Pontibacter rugosus TaxID=1745966 RepID=A0ABW3SWS5_9BACT